MKRLSTIALILVVSAAVALAQTARVGEPDPTKIGTDTAQQLLKEVSVTRFEDSAYFFPSMAVDQGLVTLRKFAGGSVEKQPIADEEALGIETSDDNVLGVKVTFFKRGPHELMVSPVRPIPIEGIAKTLSLWVIGRNYNHTLKIVIRDFYGELKELTLGKLNFTGWRKMTVAIPTSILQEEYHYPGRAGIEFQGLKIDFALAETYGDYYVYFDDLRSWTDLFAEVSRDVDDMSDDW